MHLIGDRERMDGWMKLESLRIKGEDWWEKSDKVWVGNSEIA